MYEVITILFDNFETLDVFGPVEILGRLEEEFHLNFYSLKGGIITSSQDVPVYTKPLSTKPGKLYFNDPRRNRHQKISG